MCVITDTELRESGAFLFYYSEKVNNNKWMLGKVLVWAALILYWLSNKLKQIGKRK